MCSSAGKRGEYDSDGTLVIDDGSIEASNNTNPVGLGMDQFGVKNQRKYTLKAGTACYLKIRQNVKHNQQKAGFHFMFNEGIDIALTNYTDWNKDTTNPYY